MNIEKVTKDLKSFTDFINDEVMGDALYFSSDEALKLDEAGAKLLNDAAIDLVMAKISKVMNANILDKKVDFSVFEKLPNVWKCYQNAAEIATLNTTRAN